MIYLDKGYIGNFEMADKESGRRQLYEYVQQLQAANHKRIIAPINGNTWQQYRLVNWSNGDPVFPLEPQNPLWYCNVYEELGFRPIMKYRSDKFRLGEIQPTDCRRQVTIRGLASQTDLPLLYSISRDGFKDNFLYSDISFAQFEKLYTPVLPMLDPALTIIAEIDGTAAGFIFSFMYGENLVLKSMAVLPQYRSCGVGARLINTVLLAGQQKGAKTAIAALMADDNNSHKIVSKYNSEKIREYNLYALNTKGGSA